MAGFACPSCSTAISEPRATKVERHATFDYWRCHACGTAIPADVDGQPLFDGDLVELVEASPDDFDAAVGDVGTIALANHVLQEGGPAVLPWGGFYPPSVLRLVRRKDAP